MNYKKYRFDINDLSTWRLPVALGFAVLIGFAIFSFWKVLFINGAQKEIQQTNQLIEQQKKQYTDNQSLIMLIPSIKAEVKQLEQAKEAAKEILPTEVSMPALIDSIYSAARNNNIIFDQFTPESDIDEAFYVIKPISLSMVAHYSDVANFMEDISNLQRIITVHNMAFSVLGTASEESKQRLKVTAELRTYIFKDKSGGKQ